MTAALHPDHATLRRFLLGDLPPDELEAVGRYLEDHPRAASTLNALKADDTLLSALRERDGAGDSPEVAAAAARAAGLVGGEPATLSLAPAPVGDPTADPDAADPADPLAALAPAQTAGELGRLGGYAVVRLLGRGGMGAVYEAVDDALGRRVALKVMLPALAARPAARQRFLREARAAAAVEHDHIVPIYQTGEDRGVPFLAMPLLAGESLDDRLKGGRPLAAADVIRIGREVAEGLAAAHAAGLVHRDIKPSNVWLSGVRGAECGVRNDDPPIADRDSAFRTPHSAFGRVRILDFGLARTAAADGLTQAGAVLGTPAYMAPEQARGAVVDHRADLFSLGCVLYHAATGRRPFPGADTFAVLTALATTDPPPAAAVNPAVPAGLSDLIVRLLAKDAAARPPSARAVADELARLAADPGRGSATHVALPAAPPAGAWSEVGANTTEALDPPPRRRGSHRGRWVAAGLLFAAVIALGAAYGKTIVRVATNQGELVVEVDDPATEVAVKGGAVELRREENGKKRVYLVTATTAGEVEVREPGSEAVLVTETFQLRRGGDVLVKVTADKLAAARRPTGTPPTASPADPDRAAAEHVLARGGQLKIAGRWEWVTAPADLPAGPVRLTEVGLWRRPGVTDAGLALLGACPKLTHVNLDGTGVTDAGLAHLAKLPELNHLDLAATTVTDAGLAHFRGRPGFVVLNLGGTKATAAGLAHVGDGRRLAVLNLVNLPVGDDDIRRFAPAPDLWILALGGTNVTDAGVALFAGCQKLGRLDVQRTAVTDAALAHVRAWPVLDTVVAHDTRLTDAGVAHLAGSKTLGFLHLDRTRVTDAAVSHLLTCPKLEALFLAGTAVTDAGLDALAGVTTLRALNVRGAKVTKAGVEKFAAALPACHIEWDGATIEPRKADGP